MDMYTPPEMANELKALTGEMYLQYSGVSFKDLVERPLRIARDFTISYVGKYAFAGCKDLEVVDLPNCLSVDDGAFAGCERLRKVKLPICRYIGKSAFEDCISLKSVKFERCRLLGSVRTGTDIITGDGYWNNTTFRGCIDLETVDLPFLSYIPPAFFDSQCATFKYGIFGAYYVGSFGFQNNENVVSLSFPSCTFIFQYGFAGCSNLVSLYLLSPVMCSVQNRNAFADTVFVNEEVDEGQIYVPSQLYSAYVAAWPWSDFSKKIVPYEPENKNEEEP